MGDEGVGGKMDLKTLFSQSLLSLSGGYRLPLAINHQLAFAAPGLTTSLLAGFVGCLANLTGHDALLTLNTYTSALARTFTIPCIAAEICCNSGLRLEICALNILYPAIHYLGKYVLEKDELVKPAYLELSHAVSICAIAYYTYLDGNEWGLALAFAYALASFGQELIDDPQYLVALLAIGNFIYTQKVM